MSCYTAAGKCEARITASARQTTLTAVSGNMGCYTAAGSSEARINAMQCKAENINLYLGTNALQDRPAMNLGGIN